MLSGTPDVVNGESNLVSASQGGQAETQLVETTAFRDANASSAELIPEPASESTALDFNHTIAQFLSRPTLLDEFSLTTIGADMPLFDSGRIPIRSYRLPKDILARGAKILKLANFEYFRANMVVKVMTNANPYLAGRFWIYASPYEEGFVFPHRSINKSRAAVTSYPGCELDLQTNNAVTLRIPWVDLREMGQMSNDLLDDLQVHISQLTQILADGDFKLTFQVFGWLEDVEIRCPTPAPPMITAKLQYEAKGPISEVASTVGTVANLVKSVPVLSSVAEPVAWVANAVGTVASFFGWSKPIEGSGPMPIVNVPARSFGHVKGTDAGVVMGLDNENSLTETSMNFMTTDDEMSLAHVCGRPGVVSVATWLDNAIDHAVITTLPVGPQIGPHRIFKGPERTLIDLNCFEYASTLLGKWRADIHFRISVVKTQFHTARLEVAYVPGEIKVDEKLDLTNCYRQIMDITNETEMEFVIPYMSPYPMMSTSILSGEEYPSKPTGYLVIRQLTPLTHPSTVSSSVKVVVWKWATNVTLAEPIASVLIPAQLPPTRAAKLQISLENVANPNPLVVFGKQNSPEDNFKAAQLVNGEMLVNLRPLTRAFRRRVRSTASGKVDVEIQPDMGYISRVADLYCFWRGGLSYKFYFPDEKPVANRDAVTTTIREDGKEDFLNMTHVTFTDLTPFHEISIPYYRNTRRALTFPTPTITKKFPSVYFHINHTGGEKFTTLIAGKDDFTCGFLVGPSQYTILN